MWQPIETAPLNGKPVLLAFSHPLDSNQIERFVPFDRLPCCMGWWETNGWTLPFMEEGTADSYGYSSTFYMGQIYPLPVTPTHWMPLPEPPNEKSPAVASGA